MQKKQIARKLLAAGAVAAMFSAVNVQAESAQAMPAQGAAQLSAADKKGIMDMAIANMAEIETGKLALSKSRNAEVKMFAQQMIDDHGKALSDLRILAAQKGVSLPTELDAKHKAMATRLENLGGAAFDKQYMQLIGLQDHKATHEKLRMIARTAMDPAVKAAAQKTIPVVEQHLKAAQRMTPVNSDATSGN